MPRTLHAAHAEAGASTAWGHKSGGISMDAHRCLVEACLVQQCLAHAWRQHCFARLYKQHKDVDAGDIAEVLVLGGMGEGCEGALLGIRRWKLEDYQITN